MSEIVVGPSSDNVGRRLDQVLADEHPQVSRTEIQQEIRSGKVQVSGRVILRPSQRAQPGDVILWNPSEKQLLKPSPVPLCVLYEDEELVALDKPAGLVVHPGAGTCETTLVEALLVDRVLPVADDPARPGVVHRLDRETSGVIVMAKTARAMESLKMQFSHRTVRKDYVAVVDGTFREREGLIDAPIGRDPADPQRMCVRHGGRKAETAFTVLAEREHRTLLWLRPRTGRTHQIRVHLQYINHSVQGDKKYGGSVASRMMLHAWQLEVLHPTAEEPLQFCAPIPSVFPDHPYESLRDKLTAPWR